MSEYMANSSNCVAANNKIVKVKNCIYFFKQKSGDNYYGV